MEERLFAMDDIGHLDRSCKRLSQLYDKYAENDFVLSKIEHYITEQLPVIIANIEETKQQSIERNNELTMEQDHFMHRFLDHNRYYYLSQSDLFFYYDNKNYHQTTEDYILYNIVSSISKERTSLMNWKHKTKVSLMKKIKDSSIFQSIPESCTIQHVLSLFFPALFTSKEETKFFLCILGDNILKKNTSVIHFTQLHAKPFLQEVNSWCLKYFNTQCIQTFKYKCHEKHYEMDNKDCRLVRISEGVKNMMIEKNILDILCVACHYSSRYNCSDDFLQNYSMNEELNQYVFKLKQTTPEYLLQDFTREYLYVVGDEEPGNQIWNHSPQESSIQTDRLPWKNMFYLWKDYLQIHKFPLNLYHPQCKKIICETIYPKYYNEEQDVFIGIGSSKMPIVQKFLTFWSETMVDDPESHIELEIDEMAILFRIWLRLKKRDSKTLNENQMVNILNYYLPEIALEKNKFIYHKKCSLWDKDKDIEYSLEQFLQTTNTTSLSIYDAYGFYCRLFSDKNKKNKEKVLLVSKSYFEKYMINKKNGNNGFFEVS